MANKKIANPKKEVPKGILLNDQNMAISLTECSNSNLYKEYKAMFDNIIKHQRAAYELMFKFGWYTLEQAEGKKIETLESGLKKDLNSLN